MKINNELQAGIFSNKAIPKKIEKDTDDHVIIGGTKDAEFLTMGDKIKSMKSYGDDGKAIAKTTWKSELTEEPVTGENKPEPEPELLTKEDMAVLENLIKVEKETYDAERDLNYIKNKKPEDMSITEAGEHFCTLMNKAGYKETTGVRSLFTEIFSTEKPEERKEAFQVALNLIEVEKESYDSAGDLSCIKNNKPEDMSITEAGEHFCTLMNKAGHKETTGVRSLFTEIFSTEKPEERNEAFQVALNLIGVERESYDAAEDLKCIKNKKPEDMSITEAGKHFCTLMDKAGHKETIGVRNIFNEIFSTEKLEERNEAFQLALNLIGVERESYDAAEDLKCIKNKKPEDMSITEAGKHFCTLMDKAGHKETGGIINLFTEIFSTEKPEERKEAFQVALNLIGIEGDSHDAAGNLKCIKNKKPEDMSITEAGEHFCTLINRAGNKETGGVMHLFNEIFSAEKPEERKELFQLALNLIDVEKEAYDATGDLIFIKANKPENISIKEACDEFCKIMKELGYEETGKARVMFSKKYNS